MADVRPLLVALALTAGAVLIVAVIVTSPGGGGPGGGDADGLPTAEFGASQDARIALVDGAQLGAGANPTLPVGEYRGFLYRSLIRFDPDWAGLGRVRRIELRLCASGNDRVRRGADPAVLVRRNVSGDWSEGSESQPSRRNAVTWASAPQTTDEGQVRHGIGGAGGECETIDITGLYLPAVPDALGGGGAEDLGVTILSASDDGASADPENTVEFHSREAGEQGPRLIVAHEGG